MAADCFECEVMDWDLFYKIAKKVAKKIKDSDFKPDFIIGLARGGWVLARILCDLIGVKDLLSLKVEHWGMTATADGKAKLKYPLKVDLDGKNVLIVDDITDTGESMRIAVEYIKSLKPSEIRTAALRHITSSKVTPDYFGEEMDWKWVIFPWNFTEDLCNIVPKVCERLSVNPDGEVDITQIRKELKQYYTIDTTKETLAEILQELRRRKLIQDNMNK